MTLFLLLGIAGAREPIPSELPPVPERVRAKKVKLKGVKVPGALWDHFRLELEPSEDLGSRQANLEELEKLTFEMKQLVQMHQQGMYAQQQIETVRPVLLSGVLHEDHAAALLDTWVPDGITEERSGVYRAELMGKALPECRVALKHFTAAAVAASEAGDKKARKAAEAGIERLTPGAATLEARIEACNRAYPW